MLDSILVCVSSYSYVCVLIPQRLFPGALCIASYTTARLTLRRRYLGRSTFSPTARYAYYRIHTTAYTLQPYSAATWAQLPSLPPPGLLESSHMYIYTHLETRGRSTFSPTARSTRMLFLYGCVLKICPHTYYCIRVASHLAVGSRQVGLLASSYVCAYLIAPDMC